VFKIPKIVAAVRFEKIDLPLIVDNFVVLFMSEPLGWVWIEVLAGSETAVNAQRDGPGCATDSNLS
jgi:hypothetical protein